MAAVLCSGTGMYLMSGFIRRFCPSQHFTSASSFVLHAPLVGMTSLYSIRHPASYTIPSPYLHILNLFTFSINFTYQPVHCKRPSLPCVCNFRSLQEPQSQKCPFFGLFPVSSCSSDFCSGLICRIKKKM